MTHNLFKEDARLIELLGFDARGYSTLEDYPHCRHEAAMVAATEHFFWGVPARLCGTFTTTTTTAEEDENDAEDEPRRMRAARRRQCQQALQQFPSKVSEAQKILVKKLHVNTGHPPPERFLRTLKAAGALPHVLRYVKNEFRCADCDMKHGPDHRRRAQCPRQFSFNRVLSIDVFYLRFKGKSVPMLNMVCSGTNYQVVQRIDGNSAGTPTSHLTWKAFLHAWVRFLGAPNMIICDGGSEFKGHFERGLEQLGVLQHVTIPESPWQNSKSERHGGWLKERLQREIDSGRCPFDNAEELDNFLAELTAAKLLSEDHGGLVPLIDTYHDPASLDEVGAEFRRRMDPNPSATVGYGRDQQGSSEESSPHHIDAVPHVELWPMGLRLQEGPSRGPSTSGGRSQRGVGVPFRSVGSSDPPIRRWGSCYGKLPPVHKLRLWMWFERLITSRQWSATRKDLA